MLQHEKTIMAFDELGREYIIDMFVSPRDISELQHAGPAGEEPASFKTREGHRVTHLGGGEFSVLVPGADDAVIVRTDDSEFV
ncbi:hypothetical protein HOP52_17290 [Halomonas campisalis]|uniref:Uncharacterized protein n=1 Tax=Billgrantia campisalis TaxID=74661 RepID=A0ABS9PCL7_9GAMM|nr:hypothetical protein [Halomonas campisalis]MCG6659510.1 hypothetical protein [Halomonas campisalis]MDR5864451.1 hypothetical protein [Halomonas campisalis]